MSWSFETLGNATVQVFEGDQPVLVCDPWLFGTAYFGSWALDHPLDERQIANAIGSPFYWFSHGHPDHMHHPSIERLDKRSTVLLPDHYHPEIRDFFDAAGFKTTVLPFKKWVEVKPGLRLMCLQNRNMDAILAIELGGEALVLNKNDSPFFGEGPFFRRLVKRYRKTFLLALCAVDADMLNRWDAGMNWAGGTPDERKPGAIWAVGRDCDYLDVDYYCCSSSQHIYVRADSVWANPYRITWPDMQRYWTAKRTKLVEPFVTIDTETLDIRRNFPAQVSDESQITGATDEDDWSEKLSAEEWRDVEVFVRQFKLLERFQDFVAFTVGGETRRFHLRESAARRLEHEQVGVNFLVPRRSLLETIKWGYFDDLLIGNFMKAQLFNMELYPNFSPTVAKLGGGAKVYDSAALRRFRWHFFRLSPAASIFYAVEAYWQFTIEPLIRRVARKAGLFEALKSLRRRLRGGPKLDANRV